MSRGNAKDKPALLTAFQWEILRALFAPPGLPDGFALCGGTALAAFHFGHRYSDDLDLFTNIAGELKAGLAAAQAAIAATGAEAELVRRQGDYAEFRVTRRDETKPLKLDLAEDRFPRIEPPLLAYTTIRVNSALDIAVDKLCAVAERREDEPKDFVDLYFFLQSNATSLDDLLEFAGRRSVLDPFHVAAVLAKGASLPNLGAVKTVVPLPEKAVRSFFSRESDRLFARYGPPPR